MPNNLIQTILSSPCGKRNQHLTEINETKVKKQKYRNQKIEIDGHLFDSKAEARRYLFLRSQQSLGEIFDLKLQEPFQLSVCKYKADFVYREKHTGALIVEDVKGVKTQTYILKKKMMESELGIIIKEVS